MKEDGKQLKSNAMTKDNEDEGGMKSDIDLQMLRVAVQSMSM